MYGSDRPRRPIRVIILVLAFWIGGNILQALIALGLARTGLVSDGADAWLGPTSLIIGWGLLFVVALVYREPLDDWLRRR
jgi:hypothetical protein